MRFMVPFLFLVGCGFSTGVSGSKTLGELSDDEVCQTSDAAASYADRKISASDACYVGAQFAAAFGTMDGGDFSAACETAYDECMASADVDTEECDPSDGFSYPDTCSATVSDFEACVQEEVDALKDLASNKCNEAGGGNDELVSTPACDVVYGSDCFGI